ncbi:hypothetical protein [Lysinibacillus sp. Bpr_S20]|uniref:hypothetical protein n=1 Tax=Lysinibacillus sp. Bpr_S20 TaxID=2933964 RepID=UPI0024B372E3|nr:hypothetical protein [Lysinibacillus sp. Bpr_S20]
MFFNRSWHGIGGIELRINRYKKYADTLLKGNLILVGTDLNKVFSTEKSNLMKTAR